MKTLTIRDRAFGHAGYSGLPFSGMAEPADLRWDFRPVGEAAQVYTDACIYEAPLDRTAIVWLIEPYENNIALYSFVECNAHLFREIWTHEATLISTRENVRLVPLGGCWIYPVQRIIVAKIKGVSIISSHKDGLEGHRLRHDVIRALRGRIDAFGGPYSVLSYKGPALVQYRFSVCIESVRRDYWFTEKLIDCFMVGTIPIYWGCPGIAKFFNAAGIICCATLSEIEAAVKRATPELYAEMAEAMADNYERAKRYCLAEDYIAANVL